MSENKIKKPSLLQVLFIIAGIIWVGVISATFYISSDIPKTTENEKRRVIMQDTATVADLEYNKGKIVPGIKIEQVAEPTKKLLAMGEESYTSSCASCHGDEGRGDGAGGAMLNPKPRNFHDADGWKNGREISGMFKTLVEGIAGGGMNAYEFLPVEERFALIYYVRTFGDEPFPPITIAEIEGIDALYDIQRDTKAGAQIPIKAAENKVIEENSISVEKILHKIESDNSEGDICAFNHVVKCKRNAVLTLMENNEWQTSTDAFYKLITSNTQQNGFKPSVARMSPEEIRSLQQFLVGKFM